MDSAPQSAPQRRSLGKIWEIGVRNVDFRVLQVDLLSENLSMDEFSKSTVVGGKPKSRLAPWEMPRNLGAGQRPTEMGSGDAERAGGGWGGERDQESGARGAGNPEIAARKGLESGKEEAAWWGVGAACPMHLSQRIITLGAQNWPWESLYHRNWQVVYTRA